MAFIRLRIWALFMVVPLLGGCWGRQEVNDIAIVTAASVDLSEEGDIQLTLLLAVPRLVGTSSAAGGGSETELSTSAGWVVSEHGATVMDAYRNIQTKLPRTIYFSHNRVILIGADLARTGVSPVLDFFQRNRQSQLNSFIAVIPSHSSDMLNYRPKLEKLASEIMKEEIASGIGTDVTLVEFLEMIRASGEEAFAPVIKLVRAQPDAEGGEGTSNLSASRLTAVFKGDRLIGVLNNEETRGLLWIRNKIEDSVMTVPIPESRGGGMVSAEIRSALTRLRPQFRSGRLRIRVDASAEVSVLENASGADLSEDVDMVERLFREDLEQRIETVCRKAQQELKSDIIGFGQLLYRKHPQIWNKQYKEQWEETFPEVSIEVYAEVRVVQTGLVGKDWDAKGNLNR